MSFRLINKVIVYLTFILKDKIYIKDNFIYILPLTLFKIQTIK